MNESRELSLPDPPDGCRQGRSQQVEGVADRRPDDDIADTALRAQIRTRTNAVIVRWGKNTDRERNAIMDTDLGVPTHDHGRTKFV
jgi:hypothetical protein